MGKNSIKSIWEKNYEQLQEILLNKIINIKKKIEDKYIALSEKTNNMHSKKILHTLIDLENKDINDILEIQKCPPHLNNITITDTAYNLFDHLLTAEPARINIDDPHDIILFGIKVSKDLSDVFSLIANEYEDKQIKELLITLSHHELFKKNQLEDLYDTLINNEW